MKKKLKLNDLKVESFVTEANAAKGGVDINLTMVLPTQYCTIVIKRTIVECIIAPSLADCHSVHECYTLPADQCPTGNGACPTVQVACPTNPVTNCI